MHHDRHDSSSSEGSIVQDRNRNRPPRPVYNAPIGGAGQQYAPPATMPMLMLEQGVRPLVDASRPLTQIRITLYTGQQATLDLNWDHTVAEIHTFVMSVAPTAGSYQLMSGYPPKPLADPGMTIKKAGLEMANVTMRLM